jgi:Ni,Fe-hydrogenase III large subunit/Ni,Fe-hydrogenase III component G
MAVVDGAMARVVAGVSGAIGQDLLEVLLAQPDTLRLVINAAAVRAATEALVRRLEARFLISMGVDRRPLCGDFGVVQLFSMDADELYVALDCGVDAADPRIDSISGVVPGAGWSERECRDAVGIVPVGHPDPRRLLLADDWPEGLYPLRRDVPYNVRPDPVEGLRPAMGAPPEGASVLPMGPFFPVLEEPAYLRLFVEGETIVGCDYRGFYNHRGIEKLGDSTLTYNEVPYLAERICGICGFIHSSCYCQGVEKAAGIEVPRRARYLRTVLLEVERIHSHLLWLGIAGHIVGFDTVLMQTWRIREPVMWLAEEISGNRKTYGMNTVGGVRRDLPADVIPKLLDTVAEVERELTAVRDAVVGDTTLLARTRGVGRLETSWAREVCVVGPPARASNIPIDARINHPYAAYDEVVPRICVDEGCDTWARVVVRLGEIFEAVRLIREALTHLPDGPVLTEITEPIPPGRFGVSTVEAPRGEAVHAVMTGDDNRPYRWRVRAPTYPNLQAVPAMIQHQTIADVPITLGSLDPCFSCTERLEAVEVGSGAVRVYSRRELAALAKQRGEKR